MSLRAIPGFNVFRPADAKETVASFKLAMNNKTSPSALLLTRQGVPVLNQPIDEIIEGVGRGAYVVVEEDGPELVFLATGSEVSLAMDVASNMTDKRVRVVSMPCWEIFEDQPQSYKESVIPVRGAMKISFEAGITLGWDKYIGSNGLSIGIDHFGASAPGKHLAEEFGFTPDKIESKIRQHLDRLL